MRSTARALSGIYQMSHSEVLAGQLTLPGVASLSVALGAMGGGSPMTPRGEGEGEPQGCANPSSSLPGPHGPERSGSWGRFVLGSRRQMMGGYSVRWLCPWCGHLQVKHVVPGGMAWRCAVRCRACGFAGAREFGATAAVAVARSIAGGILR